MMDGPSPKKKPRLADADPPAVRLVSFGHKKRPCPPCANIYIDLRRNTPLRNPHRDLRTGLDPALRDVVFGTKAAQEYRDRQFGGILDCILLDDEPTSEPCTVAVGCIGGRHRSVSFCEELRHYLSQRLPQHSIAVEHMELITSSPRSGNRRKR